MSARVMTWRERIAAARARGWFSEEDKHLFGRTPTCLVGECAATVEEATGVFFYTAWNRIAGDNLEDSAERQDQIRRALAANDFDAVEAHLDYFEDRTLALKREAGSAHAPASPRRAARP